jgi:hypothetical protein
MDGQEKMTLAEIGRGAAVEKPEGRGDENR